MLSESQSKALSIKLIQSAFNGDFNAVISFVEIDRISVSSEVALEFLPRELKENLDFLIRQFYIAAFTFLYPREYYTKYDYEKLISKLNTKITPIIAAALALTMTNDNSPDYLAIIEFLVANGAECNFVLNITVEKCCDHSQKHNLRDFKINIVDLLLYTFSFDKLQKILAGPNLRSKLRIADYPRTGNLSHATNNGQSLDRISHNERTKIRGANAWVKPLDNVVNNSYTLASQMCEAKHYYIDQNQQYDFLAVLPRQTLAKALFGFAAATAQRTNLANISFASIHNTNFDFCKYLFDRAIAAGRTKEQFFEWLIATELFAGCLRRKEATVLSGFLKLFTNEQIFSNRDQLAEDIFYQKSWYDQYQINPLPCLVEILKFATAQKVDVGFLLKGCVKGIDNAFRDSCVQEILKAGVTIEFLLHSDVLEHALINFYAATLDLLLQDFPQLVQQLEASHEGRQAPITHVLQHGDIRVIAPMIKVLLKHNIKPKIEDFIYFYQRIRGIGFQVYCNLEDKLEEIIALLGQSIDLSEKHDGKDLFEIAITTDRFYLTTAIIERGFKPRPSDLALCLSRTPTNVKIYTSLILEHGVSVDAPEVQIALQQRNNPALTEHIIQLGLKLQAAVAKRIDDDRKADEHMRKSKEAAVAKRIEDARKAAEDMRKSEKDSVAQSFEAPSQAIDPPNTHQSQTRNARVYSTTNCGPSCIIG